MGISRQELSEKLFRELGIKAFWLIDHGRAAEVSELFAADGILAFGEHAPNAGEIKGEAIGEFFKNREANTAMVTRHGLSNLMVLADSDSEVKVTYLMTAHRGTTPGGQPDVSFVADVVDTYVQGADGRWLVSYRLVDPVFAMSG